VAFIENNFSPIGGFHGADLSSNGDGVAVYSYITADPLSLVDDSGYFDELENKLFQGDIIFVGSSQLDDDSTDNEYTILYVEDSPPGDAAITVNSKRILAT